MSHELSSVAGSLISVKATTSEGLGAFGRGEGIAASAVVLIEEHS
jgi:2C-methyl-D-erythritol 2,4-cyclodiphosphate synthase